MKKVLAAAAACLLVFAAAACKPKEEAPPPDPNFPYMVEYSSLNASILERPARVVSLSPSITEIIYDMGLQKRLVGVSENCTYPEQASRVTVCGTAMNPDLRVIKSLKAQVVITGTPMTDSDLRMIQQMGAEVCVLPRAKNLQQLEELYKAVGGIFDGKHDGIAAAESFYKPLMRRVEGMQHGTAEAEEPMKALYIAQPYYTAATGDSFEGKLLEEIGYENIAGEYFSWVLPEDVRQSMNPQIVFYSSHIDLHKLISQPGYSTSDCLKNENFYEFDLAAMEGQGKRMFDQLEMMVKLGYPDADITPPKEEQPQDEQTAEQADGEEAEFESGVSKKEK